MTTDTFFSELQKLILAHPKRPSQVLNSENCTFGNFIYYGKDLFNCFDVSRSTKGNYLYDSHDCSSCSDCNFTFRSELCYECVDTHDSFNCDYLEYCGNMTDSYYSYDSANCHDVFGCVHLDNKSFCIFNRQFSEAEYREKVEYLKTLPPEKILKVVEDIKLKQPVTQTRSLHNENSNYGNYVFYSKNCYMCFDIGKCENCGYIHDSSDDKFTYDVTQSGGIELSYEVIDSGEIFNSDYVHFSKNCNDSSYLIDCLDVKDSLGCFRLNHKQYCILNRQFTKEEYEKISEPIIAELRAKNYGWKDLIY